MRKIIFLLLCLTYAVLVRAQSNYTYRYWFDQNDKDAVSVKGGEKAQLFIDTKALTPYLHILYLQAIDEKGVASAPQKYGFTKLPEKGFNKIYYWFDQDNQHCQEIKEEGVLSIDASALSEGMHTLHVQIVGKPFATTAQRMFYKVADSNGTVPLQCEFSIDKKPYKNEDVAIKGGTLLYDLDVTQIPSGLHTLQMHVKNRDTGYLMGSVNSMFLRVPTTQELNSLKCYYAVDGKEGFAEAVSQENGIYHFVLDVNSLSAGMHSITCMLKLENQSWSSLENGIFFKQDKGDAALIGYSYWLNDKADNSMYVQLDQPMEELFLHDNWKTMACPIRPAMFHFEWVDGVPYVFAKNEIHARFYDKLGGHSDAVSTFVDAQVSQRLDRVESICPGQTKTFGPLGSDSIQWYQLSAIKGDSICMAIDHSCKAELFAPSGAELLALPDSMTTDDVRCLASESGDYYLAIHDVEAAVDHPAKVTYLQLQYNRLRYDVNEDIFINEEDFMEIVNYYLGKPVKTPFERLDVNCDGVVDAQDAILVQKHYTGVNEGIIL